MMRTPSTRPSSRRTSRSSAGFAPSLVDQILDCMDAALARKRRTCLVGLSGLQGSGKSTLARQLVARAKRRGWPALTLSLDDFYLTRRQRQRLARERHPEWAVRGPPGTHDLDLLATTLEALRNFPHDAGVPLPRFDKGRDDRAPHSRWRVQREAPRFVVLEGWCVGVPAQSTTQLRVPANAWERRVDADGGFRAEVNRALRHRYAALWRRLDFLIALQAPSFAAARRWRSDAEGALRGRAGATRAMDAAALARFMPRFERLSRHALRALPGRADLTITLNGDHVVRKVSARTTSRKKR